VLRKTEELEGACLPAICCGANVYDKYYVSFFLTVLHRPTSVAAADFVVMVLSVTNSVGLPK